MNGRVDRDPVVEHLVRRSVATPGACPDPNLLAGRAEEQLIGEERAEVDAHVSSCPSCAAAVAAVADSSSREGAGRPRFRLLRAPKSRGLRIAAAALLAVGAGIGALAIVRGGAGTTDERLLASARELSRRRPDLFAGFAPLDRTERLEPGIGPERGPIVLLHPTGVILEFRPAFRWEALPGAASYRVSLLAADGQGIWSRDATSGELPFPDGESDLAAGSAYLWEVSADGPFGEVRARRTFEVAAQGVRAGFEEARRLIRESLGGPLADLLEAHLALRGNVLAEAERVSRRYLDRFPEDEVGQETLGRVLRAMGLPEPVESDPSRLPR